MASKPTLKEQIEALPELPVKTFEAAGKLSYADNVPVVTIRPNKFPKPGKPPKPDKGSGVLPLAPKSEALTLYYWVQAIYPRVICQEPSLDLAAARETLFVEQGSPASDRPNANPAAVAQRERFYKLTKLKGARLANPLWCSVKYGPWLAMAVEQESCTSGVPNTWQFAIVEMPEVALTWYGQWEDMPSYPLLSVITGDRPLFRTERQCCAGFRFCSSTMSCLAISIPCPDQQGPA
jgi:hypothetical protein